MFICKHCQEPKDYRPKRGLCSHCYNNKGVRDIHAPKLLEADFFGGFEEPEPTGFLPGSEWKMWELARRVERRGALHSSDDAKIIGEGERHDLAPMWSKNEVQPEADEPIEDDE